MPAAALATWLEACAIQLPQPGSAGVSTQLSISLP